MKAERPARAMHPAATVRRQFPIATPFLARRVPRLLLAILAAALAALLTWQLLPAGDSGPVEPTELLQRLGSIAAEPAVAEAEAVPAGAHLDDSPATPRTVAPPGSPTTELAVRVRSVDGQPRADAVVIVAPQPLVDPWREERTARTAADGTAHFQLAAGSWRCRTPLGGSATIAFGPGEHATVTLELTTAADCDGIVVDTDDRPIDGAEILAVDPIAAARAHVVARTDAGGRFTVRDAGDGMFLAARHLDHAPSAPQAIATGALRLRFVLTARFGRCHGIVVDGGGRPVADALVVLGADLPPVAAGDRRAQAAPSQPVRTDADGRFASGPLAPGACTARAQAAAVGNGRVTFTVAAGETASLQIQLAAPATVRGTVRRGDGTPVADAYVWNEPLRAFGCRLARSDAQGRYELGDLAAGELSLAAQLPPATAVTTTLPVGVGATGEWNPIVAVTPAGILRGRVVDGHGAACVGWRAVATAPGSHNGLGAETDADGRFTVRGLSRDAAPRLAIRRPANGWTGFPDLVLEAVPVDGPELELVVEESAASGVIAGRVVDAAGEPTAATVRLQHPRHRHVATYPTAADGTFALVGIPAGTLRIEIDGREAPRLRLPDVVLARGATVDLGAVPLALGGSAGGRLTAGDGSPATSASVLVLDRNQHEAGYAEIAGDGYRTPLLAPGDYTLLVAAEGCGSRRVPVTIAAGAHQQLDLRLDSGHAWRIAVATREPRHQAANVSVLLFDAAGDPLWFAHLPMHAGTAEFGACLAPGDYAVTALGVDDHSASTRFRVPTAVDAATAVTRLELEPRAR